MASPGPLRYASGMTKPILCVGALTMYTIFLLEALPGGP